MYNILKQKANQRDSKPSLNFSQNIRVDKSC